ncbi:lachrymatory-factor synthase-like [Salvia miltiorrhiza]|uniref:lachrymatory-factor synthase-like n=1 Tax=Salvia miltiorrhiza TaxID=226208 RepID=UPI0025AD1C1C|nr:lachrymatory-factor synthase-like [Salvia miltiorrhiza]
MEADGNLKWEGKATAKLLKPTADEVWPLLADFFSLHKWLPTIDTCFKVVDDGDGKSGGLVRHCAASPRGGDPAVRWCRERLTGVDAAGRRLSYEVVDSNMGFKSYESTLRVVPIDGGDDPGCEIEWSFVADPVDGLSCEDLAKYVAMGLQGMARNMESALTTQSDAVAAALELI